MANLEHVERLKAGVEGWNAWRRDNPGQVDLRGADLRGADLRGADLHSANLSGADLFKASLSKADLFKAELFKADLRGVDLSGADLLRAVLEGVDLSGARFMYTVFASTTLSNAKGLDTCNHLARSRLNAETIRRSWPSTADLPVAFLRGVGYSDWEIELAKLYCADVSPAQGTMFIYNAHEIRFGKAFQYYSCFISHSHNDKAFAHLLHDRLQQRGIRCWLDEHQLLPGDDIRDAIDHGINVWDKTILCCSESALGSYWVNTEIDKAFRKEERLWKKNGEKTLALIPLNLDNALFSWQNSRASTLKDRLAEDMVDWEVNPEKLEQALDRIERALRSDGTGRPPDPVPKL